MAIGRIEAAARRAGRAERDRAAVLHQVRGAIAGRRIVGAVWRKPGEELSTRTNRHAACRDAPARDAGAVERNLPAARPARIDYAAGTAGDGTGADDDTAAVCGERHLLGRERRSGQDPDVALRERDGKA